MSSLAKLTSISTKTLSLLLERQRLQTLPGYSSPAPASPSTNTASPHLAQITKNLAQLRQGILDLEEKEGSESEAVKLLKNQYDRMKGMLGADGAGIPSLVQTPSPDLSLSASSSASSSSAPPPREPLPSLGLSGSTSGGASRHAAALFTTTSSSPPSHSAATRRDSANGIFAPYKDDPSHSSSSGGIDLSRPKHDSSSFDGDSDDTHTLLQSQRFLMSEQDTRLDALSHSINRQHHLSIQINDELDVHHGLLEELDTGIDRTTNRLGRAGRRLNRVAKGIKENSSAFMIGVLIFVLLILIVVLKT